MTYRRRGIIGYGSEVEKVTYGHSGMVTHEDRNFRESHFQNGSRYDGSTQSWVVTNNISDIIGSGASPSAVAMSPDGKHLYIGRSNSSYNYIFHYTLATPFDIESRTFVHSFTTNSFGVSSIESIAISPDGQYMWASSYFDKLHTFCMSTPFYISSISYAGKRERKNWYSNSNTTLGFDTNPAGIFFHPDGTKGYITGNANDRLHQYDLTTAYDVSTMTHNQYEDLNGINSDPYGLWFKPDGSSFFFIGRSGDDTLYKRDMTTAWDISTQQDGGSWEISPNYGYYSIAFSYDGTKLYMGADDQKIRQWSLSTAWDMSSTFTDDGWALGGFTMGGTVVGMAFNSDGKELAVQASSTDNYVPFKLDTPYDLSGGHTFFTGKFQDIGETPIGVYYPTGLANLGQEKLVILNDNGNNQYYASTVNAFSLKENDNLFSLEFGYVKTIDITNASSNSDPRGFLWKYDGTRFYVFDEDDRAIYQYATSVPFLATRLVITWESYKSAIPLSTADPKSFAMSLNGRHVWFMDNNTDRIYQFDLNTPWDISDGLTDRGYSVCFYKQETSPRGMCLNPTGNKLLMVGETTDNLVEFSLPS